MTSLIMTAAFFAKQKIQNFITNEKGEVNIVTTVVLIGVGVVLALLLKDLLLDLVNALMGDIETNATNAITPTATP